MSNVTAIVDAQDFLPVRYRYVLQQILSGEATEDVIGLVHDYLEALGKRVRASEIDLEEFIILKRLGKNPQDYPDAKSQPHVQVALRMQAKGQSVKAGDVIPYVFCMGEDSITAKSAKADRAHHPDELRKTGTTLKIGTMPLISQLWLPTDWVCFRLRFLSFPPSPAAC